MSDQFIGQTLANKYRIEEAERESGLGKIYRGTHLLMDKPVTVKILAPALAVDENIVSRFSAEAKTVSQISHPNILNVTDFGSDQKGAVYIVSEGVEGETLKEAVLREGKFPLERAIKIVRQIAAALTAAHRKGVVHQHLNGENIMLTRAADESEFVKVLDFGSIKAEEDGDAFENEADLKDLEYLAPEQNASVGEADERSDIYSLGVIFFEMLTGEVPFTAENPTDLMMKQAEEPPAPLSAFRNDLPAEIEPIILKALAKNPEMRYQTAGEFSDDLLRASIDSGIVKTTAAAAPVGNIWKTISIVLIGIVALSGVFIYAFKTKQTDPTTALQTDANGQPVQPLNPATGVSEQNLSNMMQFSPELVANSNMMALPPGTLPGGDGYNPWANGVNPPAGAPPTQYIGPGGQVITIDPNNPSQFMPNEDGIIYVPLQPTNSNVNTNPQPLPANNTKNANTSVNTQPTNTAPTNKTQPTPKPEATQPKSEKTPVKPADQPKTTKPSTTEKQVQSDKKQDTN